MTRPGLTAMVARQARVRTGDPDDGTKAWAGSRPPRRRPPGPQNAGAHGAGLGAAGHAVGNDRQCPTEAVDAPRRDPRTSRRIGAPFAAAVRATLPVMLPLLALACWTPVDPNLAAAPPLTPLDALRAWAPAGFTVVEAAPFVVAGNDPR